MRQAETHTSNPALREWRTNNLGKVPQREKGEVLAAFAAHKDEVTEGYSPYVGSVNEASGRAGHTKGLGVAAEAFRLVAARD